MREYIKALIWILKFNPIAAKRVIEIEREAQRQDFINYFKKYDGEPYDNLPF